MKVFVTTMYRFGNRELHSYVLGTWSSKELAERHGQNEAAWRGGKYEPGVTEWTIDANGYDDIEGITEDGIFVCDFCGEDTGKFNQDTGNHPQCEELSALRARVEALEARLQFAVDNANHFTEYDPDGVKYAWIESVKKVLKA